MERKFLIPLYDSQLENILLVTFIRPLPKEIYRFQGVEMLSGNLIYFTKCLRATEISYGLEPIYVVYKEDVGEY